MSIKLTGFKRRFALAVILGAYGCSGPSQESGEALDDAEFTQAYPPGEAAWRLAEHRADTSELVASLDRILDWHKANDTDLVLNAPMSRDDLIAELAWLPCQVPEELLALWTWRNGERTDRFIWYHRLLSAADAKDEYRRLTTEPYYIWNPNWIPVFEHPEEWYFVECSDRPSTGSPVSLYFIETGPSYSYVNLTTYMKTMAAALEAGAISWQDGDWADEIRELAAIHARFNETGMFPYAVDP